MKYEMLEEQRTRLKKFPIRCQDGRDLLDTLLDHLNTCQVEACGLCVVFMFQEKTAKEWAIAKAFGGI